MDDKLKNWLQSHNIEYESFSHPAVFTVEEASKYYDSIKGLHCKNLFLKDSKKKLYYLVSLPFDKKIPLNELRKLIGAKKLTFASKEELKNVLNLDSGSVTPFGLINRPKDIPVFFVLDNEILNAEYVCFHPNINTETLSIPIESFKRALENFQDISKIYLE